jgi:large subunit ribosomal protein L35
VPRKTKIGKLKLKTHKATAKRFRTTATGKIVRTKGGKSHLRRNTSKRVKELLPEMITVEGENIKKHVKRLAPYMDKNR